MLIELIGKSLKGKNIVKNHGNSWRVVERITDRLCIMPELNDNDCRWILLHGDTNFHWREK